MERTNIPIQDNRTWQDKYRAHLYKYDLEGEDEEVEGLVLELEHVVSNVPYEKQSAILGLLDSWSRDDFLYADGVKMTLNALFPKI